MTAPNLLAAEALRRAFPLLLAAGVADPVRDARRLLAFAMGIGAERMTLHLTDPLSDRQIGDFDAAIARRVLRQPVSQITGGRDFFGRSFHVTADTLDPRPETECLIEAALRRPFARVLDLGTGTGCILLTLLAERPQATGLGIDLSDAALAVARGNAERLSLTDRAAFQRSDWFAAVVGDFDLIVANPPYIAAAELHGLAPEVRDWEPHLALSPGADGLAAYRLIAAGCGAHLAPQGSIIVEIGPSQGAAVSQLFRSAGFLNVAVLPDVDRRDRIVVASK